MIKKELQQELNRSKVVLDYARQEIKEKDKEIERLTAESTKWESKFYDEAKKVDKAIEFMNNTFNISSVKEMYEIMNELEEILQGSDKE